MRAAGFRLDTNEMRASPACFIKISYSEEPFAESNPMLPRNSANASAGEIFVVS